MRIVVCVVLRRQRATSRQTEMSATVRTHYFCYYFFSFFFTFSFSPPPRCRVVELELLLVESEDVPFSGRTKIKTPEVQKLDDACQAKKKKTN